MATSCLHLRRQSLLLAIRSPSIKSRIQPFSISTSARSRPSTSETKETPYLTFGAETDALITSSRRVKSHPTQRTSTAIKKPVRGANIAPPDILERAGFVIDSSLIAEKTESATGGTEQMQVSQTGARASELIHAPDVEHVKSPIPQTTPSRRIPKPAVNRGSLPSPSQPDPKLPTPLDKLRSNRDRDLEPWQIQKAALQTKFGDAQWAPRKKLSPDAMEGLRALHESDPQRFSTPVLAQQFKVSPEAIRRILKSRWMSKASSEVVEDRRKRWAKRHDRIWDHQAQLGLKPAREKDKKVGGPEDFEDEIRQKIMFGQI